MKYMRYVHGFALLGIFALFSSGALASIGIGGIAKGTLQHIGKMVRNGAEKSMIVKEAKKTGFSVDFG
jgi:hypothetical protein